MRKIVLASASPRRAELLRQIGLEFGVDHGDYTEDMPPAGADPHELVEYLSREKAKNVAFRHPGALIVAADTVVVCGDKIMGKPGSGPEARKMLRALTGRNNSVVTGFTVLDTAGGKAVTRSVETTVWMKKLTAGEINAYVRTGEPLDKAGAYGIQGLGAVIVERIEGDYFNVVGLPLAALAEALKEFGVEVLAAGR